MEKMTKGVWLDYPELKPEDGERVLALVKGYGKHFQVLTYNETHQCWDDSEGDDFEYELDDVLMFFRVPEHEPVDSKCDMREALKKAQHDITLSDKSLKEFAKLIVFVGFEDGLVPIISELHGEVFFELEGSEITAERAIERMEKVGYVTPDDLI